MFINSLAFTLSVLYVTVASKQIQQRKQLEANIEYLTFFIVYVIYFNYFQLFSSIFYILLYVIQKHLQRFMVIFLYLDISKKFNTSLHEVSDNITLSKPLFL